MNYPDFYDAAPIVALYDPLAEFLGAVDGGVMQYRYIDVVRLTGHSCPTVACAFLMTRSALRALYQDKLPVRGEIRVDSGKDASASNAGVVANVASFITGAAGAGGFKGIGGRFHRNNLLNFDIHMDEEVRFTRIDTGCAVEVNADPTSVPFEPGTRELMGLYFSGHATPTQEVEFRDLWQTRVRSLLLKHADDPAVIRIKVFSPPNIGEYKHFQIDSVERLYR